MKSRNESDVTLFLIFCTTLVVWLNRGRYDPSVPFLTLFFLKWVHASVWNKTFLPKVSVIFSRFLPWIFALLFLIRNELLYVEPAYLSVSRAMSFFPLIGMAIFTWGRKFGLAGALFWILPFFLTFLLSPSPHMDVFQSNRLAVDFFLHGQNPYSAVYPDIYRNEFDYHPGFLYWPGALYLQTVSQLIFSDIRVVLALGWVIAGFLLREQKKSLALWMTLPILAFGFEQAWLDPLIALGGALALYGIREKKHAYWILGAVLAASVKQYGFMVGLFSVLYCALEYGIAGVRKSFWIMAGAFALVMLPMILWAPHDFLQMTVLTHTSAKIRPDALNFTAFWLKMTGAELPNSFQLLAIVLGLGLAIFHVVQNGHVRRLKVVPEAWAIFFGFSIFFGKFAFCNYYWLLISFWIMAESEDVDKISTSREILRPSI
ncbi:MAG: hypothetical protein H7333_04680 [Bdellovibrionales bacterium]|nr:hypothetical protein [Oligoflexia bacterium]